MNLSCHLGCLSDQSVLTLQMLFWKLSGVRDRAGLTGDNLAQVIFCIFNNLTEFKKHTQSFSRTPSPGFLAEVPYGMHESGKVYHFLVKALQWSMCSSVKPALFWFCAKVQISFLPN